jgi:selenocysteine-specific elongation factor
LSDLEELRRARSPAHVVGALMRLEAEFAVSPEFLAQAGNLAADTIREVLRRDPSLRPLPDAANAAACTTVEKWQALRSAVVEALRAYHESHPLLPGAEMESLRTQIAPDLSPKLYRTLLDALIAEGVIARGNSSTVRLPSHEVILKRDEEELGTRAEALITAGGVTPPDLKQIETSLRVARQRLQPILQQLERQGKVVKITADLYFGREHVERARTLLRQYAEAHGEINAATFRDLLGASRKFSIALLDYFDRTGFTLRVGDVRKLRAPAR